MREGTRPVSVHILDKEYLVACPEEERDALRASARYLDQKMRQIRDAGKVVGADRIAVMAALNIAYELLARDQGGEGDAASLETQLRALQDKIDTALYKTKQLDL